MTILLVLCLCLYQTKKVARLLLTRGQWVDFLETNVSGKSSSVAYLGMSVIVHWPQQIMQNCSIVYPLDLPKPLLLLSKSHTCWWIPVIPFTGDTLCLYTNIITCRISITLYGLWFKSLGDSLFGFPCKHCGCLYLHVSLMSAEEWYLFIEQLFHLWGNWWCMCVVYRAYINCLLLPIKTLHCPPICLSVAVWSSTVLVLHKDVL